MFNFLLILRQSEQFIRLNLKIFGADAPENMGNPLRTLRAHELPPPALQAAIDSGVEKLVVPNMGKDWIVEPLFLNSDNQEIFFEPGTVIAARKGFFQSRNASLFQAEEKLELKWETETQKICESTHSTLFLHYYNEYLVHHLKIQNCSELQ